MWDELLTQAIDPDDGERTEQQELGLIARMLDGDVKQFDFRGLTVMRVRDSIHVMDDEMSETLGGAWYVVTDNPNPVHEWLETKANHYQEETA